VFIRRGSRRATGPPRPLLTLLDRQTNNCIKWRHIIKKQFLSFSRKSTRTAAGLGLLLLICALALAACAPGESPFVAIGDSNTEGVQSADANLRTQPNAYPNLIAKQVGFQLPLPLILSTPLGVVGDTRFRKRLFPDRPATNLAVAGADTWDVIYDTASREGTREIDLVLRPRFGRSQIKIVENSPAPFVIAWIGNNDVLGAVLAFDQLDQTSIMQTMTSTRNFRTNFRIITGRLHTAQKRVIYGNIPDVTRIAFLVDGDDLIRFLGVNPGLPDGQFTTIVTMFLLKLNLVGPDILKDDNFVLDADEIDMINGRIAKFNEIIGDTVPTSSAMVVNIKALFDDLVDNPPGIGNITIGADYLEGLFSLDGIHPSNIGQALVARAFIETHNSRYEEKLPVNQLSEALLLQIARDDPFVDLDGDGVVRGRPGAGLLETLAPFLGLSGDDENVAAAATRAERADGKRFIEEYLRVMGYDPGAVNSWRREDSIAMFKDVFGLN
jgi:hypothetical protein